MKPVLNLAENAVYTSSNIMIIKKDVFALYMILD
nr:MAG TPA: hypothetical protein [Caudoviricetes sp.]